MNNQKLVKDEQIVSAHPVHSFLFFIFFREYIHIRSRSRLFGKIRLSAQLIMMMMIIDVARESLYKKRY